jgi:hypothetical protein
MMFEAFPTDPNSRNIKGNTHHNPTGPPNPAKGEQLKSLLSSTPTKSLLHPIHAHPAAR